MPYNKLNLQITEKKHWYKDHPEEGYIKRLNVINGCIVNTWIETDHEIILNSVDDDLLLKVLQETGLEMKPFHVVMDLMHVREVTSNYKHSIANLLYNWKPDLRTVGLYNVYQPIRIVVESLAAVVPQSLLFIIADTYEQIVEKVTSGRRDFNLLDNGSEENLMRQRFLESVAKLTWLGMLEEPVPVPPIDNKYYPYFRAVDEIRCDLMSKETDKKKEIRALKKEFKDRIGHMNLKMNAQMELNKKTTQNQEKEIWELKTIIASLESELSRISGVFREKTATLQKLSDHIVNLEVEARTKKKMLNLCQNLIETEIIEKNLQHDLTEPESAFLNALHSNHPNLTQRELKICILVRQNHDTEEIGRSFGITKRGMESIRYRLHKKLGLEKHQSIKAYLSRLSLPV
ncbi:MAG: transcriptional regulator [Chlorobium sp.]|nr:MAG: transcriptional regulator [Chlorobium sp.]